MIASIAILGKYGKAGQPRLRAHPWDLSRRPGTWVLGTSQRSASRSLTPPSACTLTRN